MLLFRIDVVVPVTGTQNKYNSWYSYWWNTIQEVPVTGISN
jgi:hypothetical protein